DPGSQASAEGATVSLPIVATNPNGGTLRYAAVSLPPGLNIDQNTGVIHGTIDSSAAEFFGGSYQPTVIVGDGKGGSADRWFTWAVTDTDSTPTLDNPGPQSSARGDTISLPLNAGDPDNDQLIYDASGLPPGLTIGSLTGQISGTIDTTAAQPAPYPVTVTVS